MASNIEETNVEEKSSENETGGVQAEKMVKHSFSDPWKGSDLVLVVEDEKFHVHRVILRLNSPVFEAMFNSQLKESTANEIPLPEKNASGVLDFLKIIYGFQYIQERVEITMENVEDLLQLSDEYQVKQYIFDPCVKFLEDQPKTKENVMKIVALANLYNLEKVHQGCIDLLKNMKLESLSETVHLQDLDKEQTQYYLTRRIERLERFLDETGCCQTEKNNENIIIMKTVARKARGPIDGWNRWPNGEKTEHGMESKESCIQHQ
ncbi:BTB and MATH domain-containing protein 15-like isoform X2 [Orbicella faveolata]|uniref:BTB and MATH domain-containing protein 15-like isoform X2 n=1 Tax=Orbicella faveolata TaxID=48498 RepID=UPI0009E1950D|nr:BTB and MATH domain-containing protein 15-like isoform X2 [Orbicella faveolata]